ncbi:unnamed protein product [Toxocara canis]|uniref:RING-CH-type domain-containing protein n=1 Tax=Toxocara canis TaxID=6265 RepID=A0A183UC39_TOXCA|nr:unnamed protein product [Toxocara canis]
MAVSAVLEEEELKTGRGADVGILSPREIVKCYLRVTITSSRRLSCRICLEEDNDANMISPCSCRGSLQYVHARCLQHWFDVMHTKRCQICKTDYEMEYRGMKPVSEWSLPSALSEEWEDQLDFKCAMFWLLFMTRILFAILKFDY